MDDYSEKICEACSIDAPVASDSSVSEFLKNHTEWKWADDREFPQIVRVYKFSRYLLGFVEPKCWKLCGNITLHFLNGFWTPRC